MAFDLNSYFTTRGRNVERGNINQIKEAAEALLAAPKGITNNSSYLGWASSALNFVKDYESGSQFDTRDGKEVSKLDLAYDWLVGNMQPTRGKRVWDTYGEGSKEWLAKIRNEEANIANIQADGKTKAPDERINAYNQSVQDYNKTFGGVFGTYSSTLKVSPNGYIENVGADGKPVSAAIGGGSSTPAARTPAQQAAIDRQLAIEQQAGVVPGAAPKAPPVQNIPGLNTNGLNEAALRRTEGKANDTDLANLSYAESKGWVDPYKSGGASQSSGLNTVGLLEADARRRKGTATATDLANLTYAESKGWTPTGTPATSSGSSTGGSIPGLNTVGLAEAWARKLAGTANATDLANISYAQSKGWSPSMIETSKVSSAEEANRLINAEQDADISSRTTSDEPGLRKTTEDLMNDIREAITPDVAAPEAPNYAQSLEQYRAQYGLSALEQQASDLTAELEAVQAAKRMRIAAEGQKTVATNVIAGRVSEVERQENERIDALNRQLNSISNQLNTKYNVVNSLMEAKEMDYNAAVTSYDKQMEQNISLFNAAQSIEEQLKSDEQRAIDNARSSAQIMINGLTSSGMSYDQLSPSQQAMITKLGVESGLGADFYKTVLSATLEVGKEILTQITSDDKSQVSIIYKDGTTAVVPTGFARGVNTPVGGRGGSGGGGTSDEEKEIAAFRKDAAEAIEKLESDPNYTWGAAWDSLRVLYPNASPELLDSTLGGGYDPSSESYYGRANR